VQIVDARSDGFNGTVGVKDICAAVGVLESNGAIAVADHVAVFANWGREATTGKATGVLVLVSLAGGIEQHDAAGGNIGMVVAQVAVGVDAKVPPIGQDLCLGVQCA
jgi:hypothetical protein